MRRLSLFLACLAALTMLSACGSGKPAVAYTGSSCKAGTDSVSPGAPLAKAQPPNAPVAVISSTTALKCGTILTVTRHGSATARYGNSVMCELEQNSSQTAKFFSREPSNDYFSLAAGEVVCDIFTPPYRHLSICGEGTINLNGQVNFDASCSQDPGFDVRVELGSLVVSYPGGSRLVAKDWKLTYNSLTRRAKRSATSFKPAELTIFGLQARELGEKAVG